MQALQRIMAILEVVAARADATASVVAEETGLSLSTVARLLTQLVEEHVLTRTPDGRFSIGSRIMQIARSGSDRFDLRALAQPVLDELRDHTGETIGLHVRAGSQRICIAVAASRHAVSRVVPVGLALPLPGSATGEVLLSGVPDAQLASLVGDLSDQEIDELRERLHKIRTKGWAMVTESFAAGVTGIAAPVTDPGGDVVACVSCSGPTQRFSPTVAREQVDALCDAAMRLSQLHASSL